MREREEIIREHIAELIDSKDVGTLSILIDMAAAVADPNDEVWLESQRRLTSSSTFVRAVGKLAEVRMYSLDIPLRAQAGSHPALRIHEVVLDCLAEMSVRLAQAEETIADLEMEIWQSKNRH
jgi:hypothetical protein